MLEVLIFRSAYTLPAPSSTAPPASSSSPPSHIACCQGPPGEEPNQEHQREVIPPLLTPPREPWGPRGLGASYRGWEGAWEEGRMGGGTGEDIQQAFPS